MISSDLISLPFIEKEVAKMGTCCTKDADASASSHSRQRKSSDKAKNGADVRHSNRFDTDASARQKKGAGHTAARVEIPTAVTHDVHPAVGRDGAFQPRDGGVDMIRPPLRKSESPHNAAAPPSPTSSPLTARAPRLQQSPNASDSGRHPIVSEAGKPPPILPDVAVQSNVMPGQDADAGLAKGDRTQEHVIPASRSAAEIAPQPASALPATNVAPATAPVQSAQQVRTANVLASLLPKEDLDAHRKAREDMLASNEIEKPKMIEFDVNFDDDDLLAVEDIGDDAEIVEDFTLENETAERTPQRQNTSGRETLPDGDPSPNTPAAATASKPDTSVGSRTMVFDGIDVKPSDVSAEEYKLDKKWFVDRGVVPPKSIVWKQDKTTVSMVIYPADAESGWELSGDGFVLDFTSTAQNRNTKIVLALLHPLRNPTFSLDASNEELHFTGEKIPVDGDNDDDSGDDAGPGPSAHYQYWTQLIRGSRKDYGALTFLSRAMDDDEDDGGQVYEYGKQPCSGADGIEDEGAFSAAEDD